MKKTIFAICIFAVSSCALAETETIDGITWNYTIEDGEAWIWDVMVTTDEPIISWSPELSAAEAAKRSYTTYGKVRLTDPDWTPIDGDEADYNFFKVEVKMK